MTSPKLQLTELTVSLENEIRLVRELTDAVIRQRDGVVKDDAVIVDATANEISRTLAHLESARSDRALLVRQLTASETTPLSRLEAFVDGPLPARLVTARTDLRSAAEQVTSEMTINYHVLVHAVRWGEAFLQQILAPVGERAVVYGHGEPAPSMPGAILDRSA